LWGGSGETGSINNLARPMKELSKEDRKHGSKRRKVRRRKLRQLESLRSGLGGAGFILGDKQGLQKNSGSKANGKGILAVINPGLKKPK